MFGRVRAALLAAVVRMQYAVKVRGVSKRGGGRHRGVS